MPIKFQAVSSAFTLAELLIALAILGVIATFTIPKVLVSSQNGQFLSVAKEDIAVISGAYEAYKLDKGSVDASMVPRDLTPYINYVRLNTQDTVDAGEDATTFPCSATEPCLQMHNGSTLFLRHASFGGTSSSNAISFYIDPDGKVDGTVNGVGKSVFIYLYYNGKITDIANATDPTQDSSGLQYPYADSVPPWFVW